MHVIVCLYNPCMVMGTKHDCIKYFMNLAVRFLGFLALGKHLVQALPSVYALQCLTANLKLMNK